VARATVELRQRIKQLEAENRFLRAKLGG
jgi:hypothetical protein